jgi:hypothetical protein
LSIQAETPTFALGFVQTCTPTECSRSANKAHPKRQQSRAKEPTKVSQLPTKFSQSTNKVQPKRQQNSASANKAQPKRQQISAKTPTKFN